MNSVEANCSYAYLHVCSTVLYVYVFICRRTHHLYCASMCIHVNIIQVS